MPKLFLPVVLLAQLLPASPSVPPPAPQQGTPALFAEGAPGEQLGRSLATDGRIVLATAPGATSGDRVGAVLLLATDRVGGALVQRLYPGEPTRPLAAAGGTIVLAERAHAHPFVDTGVVYVLEPGGADRLDRTTELHAPRPRIGTSFGAEIAIDGTRLIVGASRADGGAELAGAAFVYDRGAGAGDWALSHGLWADDGGWGDRFGEAVALQRDTAFVGAPEHGHGGRNAGAVYVFTRDGRSGEWSQAAEILPPTQAPGLEFGAAVMLRGDRLAVGAPGEGEGTAFRGAVYVYRRSDQEWNLERRVAPPGGAPSGEDFGRRLALGDDVLAVGAPGHDAEGTDSGAVYLFRLGANADAPTSTIVTAGSPASRFGSSLGLAGEQLFVGAPGHGGGRGAVYRIDVEERLRSPRRALHRVVGVEEGLGRTASALRVHEWGLLWIGTHEGLHVYDGTTLRAHRPDPDDPRAISHRVVLALERDPTGNYWVGTEDGLNRFDPRRQAFERYELPNPRAYPRQSIVALLVARDGRLWTGTNGRLYHHDPAADRFVEFAPFTGVPEQLDEPYISGLQQDSRGDLWVLAKNLWETRASLYRIDLEADAVTRFPVSDTWGQVGPLLVDSAGGLWIKGPAALTPPREPGQVLPPSGPLIDSSHWAFLETRDAAVWGGTVDGFYRVPRGISGATPVVRPRERAPAVTALHEAPDGSVYLGLSDGVYRVAPPGEGASASKVAVTGIRISGRSGERSEVPFGLERLVVGPGDFSFSIEYSALEFGRPRSSRFRYRLVGFEDGWVDAEERRQARYTNVPSGDYVFRVELAGIAGPEIDRPATDGPETAAMATLPIVVRAPWWGTLWFRLLFATTVAGVAFAGWRYHRARVAELERLRLRIAGDLHDDLSTDLSGIALMSEILQGHEEIAAGDREQLGAMSSKAKRMVNDLRDLVWLIDPGHDNVPDLLARIRTTANTLLQGTPYTFHVAPDVGDGAIRLQHRRHVLLVCKELLHNVARHSGASRVEIRVTGSPETFQLEVIDDGTGFEPAAVEAGHGLRSMRRRAEQVGATLTLDSAPGRGTHAVFRLDPR